MSNPKTFRDSQGRKLYPVNALHEAERKEEEMYRVVVKQIQFLPVLVEANSAEEAEDLARTAYYSGEINMADAEVLDEDFDPATLVKKE